MSFTIVTVTGQFDGPANQPAQGIVTAELSTPITNGTEIVETNPVQGCLDSNGRLVASVKNRTESTPFRLVANDDPATHPVGSHYRFTLDLDNAPTRSFFATISHAVATVDLSELEPS